MAMNGLENLSTTLENLDNEVHVDPQIGQQAMVSLTRMLDFAASEKVPAMGEANIASPA
jgi:quinolinate synthase